MLCHTCRIAPRPMLPASGRLPDRSARWGSLLILQGCPVLVLPIGAHLPTSARWAYWPGTLPVLVLLTWGRWASSPDRPLSAHPVHGLVPLVPTSGGCSPRRHRLPDGHLPRVFCTKLQCAVCVGPLPVWYQKMSFPTFAGWPLYTPGNTSPCSWPGQGRDTARVTPNETPNETLSPSAHRPTFPDRHQGEHWRWGSGSTSPCRPGGHRLPDRAASAR
jgi:hypothetical protein